MSHLDYSTLSNITRDYIKLYRVGEGKILHIHVFLVAKELLDSRFKNVDWK